MIVPIVLVILVLLLMSSRKNNRATQRLADKLAPRSVAHRLGLAVLEVVFVLVFGFILYNVLNPPIH